MSNDLIILIVYVIGIPVSLYVMILIFAYTKNFSKFGSTDIDALILMSLLWLLTIPVILSVSLWGYIAKKIQKLGNKLECRIHNKEYFND